MSIDALRTNSPSVDPTLVSYGAVDDFNNFLSTQQILAGNSNPNPLQPDVWAYGVGTGAAVPAQFKGGVFILSPSGNPLDFSSADDGKSNTIFAAKPVTFGSINQTIRNFSLRGGYGGGGVATWKPDNNYWEAGPGVSAVLNVGVPVMVWFNIRGGLPNDFTGTVSSNVGIAVAVDQVAARGLAGLALISAAIPTPPTQGAAAGLGTAAGALTATGQGANLFVGGGYRVEMRFTGGNLNGIFYKGQKILDFDQFVRDAAQSTRDRYRPPVIPNRGIPAIADYNYTSQLVFGTSPWDLARTSGGLNQGNGAIAVANAWSSVIREYGFARLGQLPSDVAGIVLTGPNNMADAGKAVNAILSLVGQQEASQILNRLQNPYNLDFGVFGVKLANELFPGLRPGDYQFVRNAFEGRYRYILDNPRALLDDPVLVASAGKLYGILGIKKGDNPELDKVIELAEAKAQGQPLPDQIAAVLKDVSTYLGWIQSIVSKIDPAIGSGIGKAVTLANTGNLLLEAFSGNPNVSSGKLDDAALALFNAAAAFSPEIARIAPYVNTGKQALDVITGLSSGALTGPAAGASISSLAASLTGILGAPRELTLALEAAALAFRGVSLFAAGAVAGLVPVIGWAVSVVTFIIGLFAGNKEHWSNWQSILNQVSVDGGQNPITGQVLTNDTVDQKTSDKDRNRVRYNGQASEAPIQSVGYSIRPETTFVNAANGRYNIASMSSVDWDGADQGPVRDLRNANRITIVIDGQQHTLSSRGTDDSSGERLWNGSDGNDGWITISEGQLAPQTEVATGNYILDLNVTFASINPDVKAVGKSQSSTISADQAAQLRATFGVDAGTIGGADGRIASLKPFIAQMGEVRWETDHTTPNVYTYDDFNADGVPDLMRQGILDGLRVDNDGKFEVFINTAIGSPQFSYTAKSQEQAYAVGSRATVLMLYLASHPELYDLYLSQPQAHAAGNITPLYEWAQSNGVMAKLDQILALAGPPQGATLADQLQNMVDRGAQIASLKKELGISVDPAHLDTYPDLAAAFKHNTLQLLNHYIQYGNSEGRAVNESGQMLMRWQPRADGWGNAQSLAYIASYGDLMDAIGANADVGRAHWSNHGRWENRGITFSVDGYLASRPDVRAAAIAQLTLPGTVSSGGGEDSDSRAYVIVPTGDGGSARLYSRGTDENSGEAVWAGSDGNDGWISMTQSQINTLATPIPPAEDQIREFALTHYITIGRFEVAGVAPLQTTAVTPTPQAPPINILGDRTQNRFIVANEALRSDNGRYMAVMQTDGNFVVYDRATVIWASNTAGKAAGGSVAIQGDGNLVIYAPGSDVRWASNTSAAGVNRAFMLVMQDDGNLVVYDTQGTQAIWSSLTGRVTLPQPNAQFQSQGWSDLTALTYTASYADLMNAFGANSDAARAHFTNHGHGENRGVTFNLDAYLASRPDVRNAAIAGLSQPGVNVVLSDGESSAYVEVPTGDGGSARLYSRGTDENSGEAVWAGSDGNDGWISMTQSQINLLAAPVPPLDDSIRLFAVRHYINHGRFELAHAA